MQSSHDGVVTSVVGLNEKHSSIHFSVPHVGIVTAEYHFAASAHGNEDVSVVSRDER